MSYRVFYAKKPSVCSYDRLVELGQPWVAMVVEDEYRLDHGCLVTPVAFILCLLVSSCMFAGRRCRTGGFGRGCGSEEEGGRNNVGERERCQCDLLLVTMFYMVLCYAMTREAP